MLYKFPKLDQAALVEEIGDLSFDINFVPQQKPKKKRKIVKEVFKKKMTIEEYDNQIRSKFPPPPPEYIGDYGDNDFSKMKIYADKPTPGH